MHKVRIRVCLSSIAEDDALYGKVVRVSDSLCRDKTRSDRAAPIEHLGLRKIQRILALDLPAADVVTDGVADDLSLVYDEGRPRALAHWGAPTEPREGASSLRLGAGAVASRVPVR